MSVTIPGLRRPFRNDSKVTIPAWGVIRADEVFLTKDDKPTLSAKEPWGASAEAVWLNGPVSVPPQKCGACHADELSYALFEPADGTPSVGEPWGPVYQVPAEGDDPGKPFRLRKGYGGFIVQRKPDTGDRLVLVRRAHPHIVVGELNDDLAAGAWDDPQSTGLRVYGPVAAPDSSPIAFEEKRVVLLDVINRNPAFAAADGDVISVIWLNGEWSPLAAASSDCPSSNCIQQWALAGPPTGGTWTPTLTIDGTDYTTADPLAFNISAADLQTALRDALSSIGSAVVDVTGGPIHQATVRIEFVNELANQQILLPEIDYSTLNGFGIAPVVRFNQIGRA